MENRIALPARERYEERMRYSSFCNRIPLLAFFVLLTALVCSPAKAEDWTRVASKDGKFSALFPVDLRDNPQVEVDSTPAGKVTSYFGEYYGDGIVLAGSGADIPFLARAVGKSIVFDGSKDTFLKQAQGTEISFKETTVGGAPAYELLYKGDGYQGKGDPYQGHAFFIMVNKRMYCVNAVISKATPENEAAKKKLFDSMEVSG
jgi:hypothetical protein